MKSFIRIALLLVIMVLPIFMVEPSFAADITNGNQVGSSTNSDTGTDGAIGEQLSRDLYCNGKSLVEGNIGLLLGLLLVFGGIWSLIKGGKIVPVLITVFSGAVLTALPSLIESGFLGLSNLLAESDITPNNVIYAAPDCSAAGNAAVQRDQNYDAGLCTGGTLDCS